jgi:hypothetical protein
VQSLLTQVAESKEWDRIQSDLRKLSVDILEMRHESRFHAIVREFVTYTMKIPLELKASQKSQVLRCFVVRVIIALLRCSFNKNGKKSIFNLKT